MDPIIILQAGVASGTVLLFATLGEVFAERAGVLNLGVEGMMLLGAMTGFSVTFFRSFFASQYCRMSGISAWQFGQGAVRLQR